MHNQFFLVCFFVFIVTQQDLRGASQPWEREDLRTPGLVVETSAPINPIIDFKFAPRSSELLVAGLDKVVRQWTAGEQGFDRDSQKIYRWAIYREQRGSIYATALSSDGQLLAVGGFGLRNGSVAVLDRQSGKVLYGLKKPKSQANITSLSFFPNRDILILGRFDGSVAVWNYQHAESDVTEIGRHSRTGDNRVFALQWTGGNNFTSIAEDGSVVCWNITPGGVESRDDTSFQMMVHQAAFDASGKKSFALGENKRKEPLLQVRDESNEPSRMETIALPPNQRVFCVAFGADGKSMCIARENGKETEIVHYQLGGRNSSMQLLTKISEPISKMSMDGRGKFLAFSTNTNDVVLWSLEHRKEIDRISGPGGPVTKVAFNVQGNCFGYRNHENPTRWNVFDMENRTWKNRDIANRFVPHETPSVLDQWAVEKSHQSRSFWQVRNTRSNETQKIPMIRDVDHDPECFVFLRKDQKHPNVRLIIGHQWGASLFELPPQGPMKLLRKFVGHQGDVISLGVSADQRKLITGSRDRTIAVWTLDPWENQSELGANFLHRNGKLFVGNVAQGSPAWEAGLEPNSEIVRFAYDGQYQNTPPGSWLKTLQNPVPGNELVFHLKKPGQTQETVTLTTVRQRPLWRFFSDDTEWILWRWRDYYYDCSTHGDSLIGWQVNSDVDETPVFTTAEQSRQLFHRPDLVAEMLQTMKPNIMESVDEHKLLGPRLRLEVQERQNQRWSVHIHVERPTRGTLGTPSEEVCLWINDHKIKRWLGSKTSFSETVELNHEHLRAGKNTLLAQAYSKFAIRGDSAQHTIETSRPPFANTKDVSLFGLCIGINDYGGNRDLVFCREDAESIQSVFNEQQTLGIFKRTNIVTLADSNATRENIVRHLKSVTKHVGPDDVFVLFFAGHGWAEKISERMNIYDPASFIFVPTNFDSSRPHETGVDFFRRHHTNQSEALYDLLAAMPCHKVVILDCCHSGSIVGGETNLIRSLVPETLGPIILVSCAPHEISWASDKKEHGMFTASLLEAFGAKFSQVDTDKNKSLDCRELSFWAKKRTPELLESERETLEQGSLKAGDSQIPQIFLPAQMPKHIFFAPTR